ncbi:MAG: hypothetical protein OEQ29_03405 [Alphaproteobacteria bacterium]|nr:hypothetical protein [Alphaproteobacteria bacterium]
MRAFVIEAIVSLGALSYGTYEFFRLRAIEKAGEPVRFGNGKYEFLDRFFYDLAGSWGVGGFYALIALLFAFWAFRTLKAQGH